MRSTITKKDIKPGVCITDYYGEIGTIKADLGFGFTVQWHEDGTEITYNWERDSEGIKHLSVISEPVAHSCSHMDDFSFPQVDVITQQIAQLQTQLAKYQDCQTNANQLKEQVASQAQLMLELGVKQQVITDWANRLYFLVTGTNVGEMTTNSVELAAKLMLAEQENKSLQYQLSNASAEVEALKQERDELLKERDEAFIKSGQLLISQGELKQERDRLLNSIQELEAQFKSEPKFVIGDACGNPEGERVQTQKGEGVVTTFVYGNPVVKLLNGEFQFNASELTKIESENEIQFKEGDQVRIIKGKHKDKFATIKEIGEQISCWVNDEFYFHFTPGELELVTPNPELEPQRKAEEFISKLNKKTTWHQIKEVCQGDVEVWREICVFARTKTQKALIESVPQLLANYIEETGDRSDLEWIGDTLKAKVEALLVPKEEVA
ncbi:hypothetical protein ACX27_27350 [Nostoc piscinale CENA21]|uniref:KOW domain-containing protein n=1 Tax=Nostoc piscinale CENA21 TaxID=224013 RepID=A0A0M3V6N0_9NOSO|nr:hypothetical protein [Nostoc piscinale]ALF55727.1 hypothetical protein ACX27_27350 [Nostoc piscinale CENA21]